MTGPGLDPPEGDDNIFFPVLPQRQGGVFFFSRPLSWANNDDGKPTIRIYSVHIYRPPGWGKPGRRTANSLRGFPASEILLPLDSIFLTATHEALPEEANRAWTGLKAVAFLPTVLGPNPSSDTWPSLSLYFRFVLETGIRTHMNGNEARSEVK